MSKHWLLLATFTISLQASCQSAYHGCKASEDLPVYFSSGQTTDKLSVSISGSPCIEASVQISIADGGGVQLYHFEWPATDYLVGDWDDFDSDEAAEGLLRRIVDQLSFGSTSELPIWMPEAEYYEENFQQIEIERGRYEALRDAEWRTLTHPTYYEGWRIIAFDQFKKAAVVVSDGGV